MKVLIIYETKEYQNLKFKIIFDKIKNYKDSFEEKIIDLDFKLKKQEFDILISVYKTQRIEGNFEIKILESFNEETDKNGSLQFQIDNNYGFNSPEFAIPIKNNNIASNSQDQNVNLNTNLTTGSTNFLLKKPFYKNPDEKINENLHRHNFSRELSTKNELSESSLGNFRVDYHEILLEQLFNTVTNVIYSLYNFTKYTLQGLTVKDSKGSKIKPKIVIYIKHLPTFKVLNPFLDHIKNPDKCIFKSVQSKFYEFKTYCTEDMFLTYSEDVIFNKIINKNSLVFENSDLTVKIVKKNEQVFSSFVKFKNKENLFLKSIYEVNFKMKFIRIIEAIKREDIQKVIIDAFTNSEYNSTIQENFNKMLKEITTLPLVNEQILFSIVQGLPKFIDHRKNYKEQLNSSFLKINRINATKKESSTYKFEYNADETPLGSLKEFYYQK